MNIRIRISDCANIRIVFEIANFFSKNFPKIDEFDENRGKDDIKQGISNKKWSSKSPIHRYGVLK
jgi:hypothetical protein